MAPTVLVRARLVRAARGRPGRRRTGDPRLAEGLWAPHPERHPGIRADAEVPPGHAAGHLVAASRDAGLVVVGRHRRPLLAPARMLGSATQALLPHAASPVAVVPPGPPDDTA
ncbi:universal stress protein [Streptomyces sp. AGS-58]|uniref:universal stress protein n=1 Tax=unclassified Streptomyces TaxID=2593676 RepID=UPI0035A3BFE7